MGDRTPVDWSGVPMHLVELIFEKVELTKDVLQFGVVCEKWHYALKGNQSIRINMSRHSQIPMLLVPDENDQHSWSVYNVAERKFLSAKLWKPYGRKRFCGSSQGWLVVVNNDGSVTLDNPFSKAASHSTIHLPRIFPLIPKDLDPEVRYHCVSFTQYHDFHVHKVFITSDPLANPDECYVVAMFRESGDCAVIRPGKDSRWTPLRTPGISEDIMQCGSQLYFVNNEGGVHSVNLNPYNLTWNLVECFDGARVISSGAKRYLVKSSHDHVYLIVRYHNNPNARHSDRLTKKFKIFKCNLSRGRWRKVTSIGNNAIFLGDNSTICVRASRFTGCQKNCIYFTHDLNVLNVFDMNMVISDVGIYNVKSEKFQFDHPLSSDTFRNVIRRYPLWVVPTFDEY